MSSKEIDISSITSLVTAEVELHKAQIAQQKLQERIMDLQMLLSRLRKKHTTRPAAGGGDERR